MHKGESKAYIQTCPAEDNAWQPVAGDELERLLRNEFSDNNEAMRAARTSALSVLSKSTQPNSHNDSRTGLICGQVQSGKTMSFTAVAAAGHDNGIRLIIVIVGTKKILAKQSCVRLLRDLGVVKAGPLRPWRHFHNPDMRQKPTIRQELEAWNINGVRDQTVLITVLKHHKRINDVAGVLGSLGGELLSASLIIDDEADQASLNNLVRKGKRSSVYRAITSLREAIPSHTYLQYTATPQANIFIPLIDQLSPDFCEILEPGAGYIGGHYIFKEHQDKHVKLIRDDELPQHHVEIDPPRSLVHAVQLFLIGVACGLIEFDHKKRLNPQNRSMLVHPSRLVRSHATFSRWINQILCQWNDLLLKEQDPDHDELTKLFEPAYKDLLATVGVSQMAPFEDVMRKLPGAIRETEVRAVNKDDVGQMDWDNEWSQKYAWILVGGDKLERGFTIEGLTVTYMPRGAGMGYADTIQQRGRFFGYKADYISFCRIYLEADVCNAFTCYVESEDSMCAFLRSVSPLGHLKNPDLKRRFQMDKSLRPTRRSVLLDDPEHRDFQTGWFEQKHPHADAEISSQNMDLINQFSRENDLSRSLATTQCSWLALPERSRKTHLHEVSAEITLKVLYEKLLRGLLMSHVDDDSQWQVLLAMLENASEIMENLPCYIIWMRPTETVQRGTSKNGAIRQLHMGANPNKPPYVYKGDRHVHKGSVTLQIHNLQIHEDKVDSKTTPRWHDMPTIAVWLGSDIRTTFIVQEQR